MQSLTTLWKTVRYTAYLKILLYNKTEIQEKTTQNRWGFAFKFVLFAIIKIREFIFIVTSFLQIIINIG